MSYLTPGSRSSSELVLEMNDKPIVPSTIWVQLVFTF